MLIIVGNFDLATRNFDLATRIHIWGEAVHVLLCDDALWKGMNPFILPPAIDK